MARLVDADALLETLNKEKIPYNADINYFITHAPTVDPVKRGHWKMMYDPFGFFDEIPVCSECGCTTVMRKTHKFCPNCGAKMDEVE